MHAPYERTLAADDLIMRERQDMLFAEGIDERKGQLVVMVFAVNGVKLKIGKGIVHKSHIPFEIEAEAAVIDGLRDLGICAAFLGNHEAAGAFGMHHCIQILEEFYRIEILPSAETVGTVELLAEIMVQHTAYRIDPESVGVELLEVVDSIQYQEFADIEPFKVEKQSPPLRHLRAQRIGAFKHGLAVKASQPVRVLSEMRRNPIKDYADALLMRFINEPHQVFGGSEPCADGIVACDLIPPAIIKGVFHDGQKLYMRIAHILGIGNKLRKFLLNGHIRFP